MNNAFFKFFQDIVLSSTWKKLTPSARTLYPVLAIHTDRNFKPVYPSLKRLKELSGLGNGGIASGLKSLEANGLIRKWSGKSAQGNRANWYELIFEYPGSGVTLVPQQAKGMPAMGVGLPPQQGRASPSTGQTLRPPTGNLHPQRASNKRKRTKERATTTPPPTQTTTIQGDVHIQIDHGTNLSVLDALKQFFSDELARQIANDHAPEYIKEKIEITRYNQDRGKVRDPAAYLRRAITQDYTRPRGFTTSTDHAAEESDRLHLVEIMERIHNGQLSVARHRETRRASLVDVPSDLSYIILHTKKGAHCINTWEEASQYDFEA